MKVNRNIQISLLFFFIAIGFSRCALENKHITEISVRTYYDSLNYYSSPAELLTKNVLKQSVLHNNTIYKGYKTSNMWFELSLKEISGFNYLQISNSLLDNICIYKIRNNQITDSIITGDTKPFQQREFKLGTFLFSIDTSYQAYLFKVNTKGMLSIPLVLLTSDDIIENKHLPNLLYLGVIFLAIVFNVILLARFKERMYIFYFGSILSICISVCIDWGFLFQFFWPGMPKLNDYMGILYSLFIFIAIFAAEFLELKKNLPLLYKIYLVIYGLFIFTAFLNIINHYNLSVQILGYLTLFTVYLNLISGILALRYKKHVSTYYFILAFLSYSFFTTYYIISYMGFVKFSILSNNAIPISNTCEIVFLFLAVIERFYHSERERKKSDQLLLTALKNNQELLEKQNITLEKNVEERTQEIMQLNEELVSTNEELFINNEKLHEVNSKLELQNKTLENTIKNLKETQEKLLQSEKMAALGTLTAGVAHEINNPLNFINGGLNLLKDVKVTDIVNQDKFKLSLQMIKEGILRASNIVKSLTIYSYKGKSKLQKYNIEQILDDCLVLLKSKFPEDLHIEKLYQLNSEILVYPDKLHQVFLNILDNAVYECKNVKDPILRITTKTSDDGIIVKIYNKGNSIPDNVVKHIFDPFFTTKDPGEGTGLGLSISFNIIEEHRGSITVDNISDGVEFNIILPLVQQLI